jgi:hypothetical protein|tara:strand:- start:4035 stop:4502 length:468 start_codon:yes stop_codon:yes gene_type:complete
MVSSRTIEIPVSINPTDAIRAMREIGESEGWAMERIDDSTIVQRWAIIVPITRSTRVLGIQVNGGKSDGLILRTWSFIPGSAGRISFVSFSIPDSFDGLDWNDFLEEWVSRLPRCPWKWSFIERSVIGYLIPEFRISRKRFANEGIDLNKWKSSD